MGQWLIMKIRGLLMDHLLYLRTLTVCTVLSTGLLIWNQANSTLVENTSGSIESLEVNLGGLKVRAIGKNTTEVLMNLMKNVVDLEITPSSEGRYFQSMRPKVEPTMKKHVSSFFTMSSQQP